MFFWVSSKISEHNRRRPVLALVKDGPEKLMLRTWLQNKGFVVVTVDWQQRVGDNPVFRSTAIYDSGPNPTDLPNPQEALHPTSKHPTMVKLGMTSRPNARSVIRILECLLEHP